jgi:hypothetical protein
MSFGAKSGLPEMVKTVSAYSEPRLALMTAYVYRPLFDILLVVPVLLSMPNASIITV